MRLPVYSYEYEYALGGLQETHVLRVYLIGELRVPAAEQLMFPLQNAQLLLVLLLLLRVYEYEYALH